MRKQLEPHVERRRQDGPRDGGPYGHFLLTHPQTRARLYVIVSDGRDWAESGFPLPVWEHASVSVRDARSCPTWAEMEYVRCCFWQADELVLQLSVPRAQHINCHEFVLHLWRPVGVDLPLPPRDTV